MVVTGDNTLMKEINRTVVLETIRQHSPISRAEVNRISGLNKGTVSNIVSELINEHLVYEKGLGKSSGGRKPLMLMFNNKAGHSIGINVEINQITAILTDLKGKIIDREVITLKEQSVDYIFDKLINIAETLIANAPKSEYGIVGIGVGFPGTIDATGTVRIAPTLKWKNVPLQKMLNEKLDIPTTIANEARVGAQGETAYGLGANSTNMLYISISNGIGTSLVLNKQVYKGDLGFAGDAGHMTFDINGEICDCGNIGCWQHYASVTALLNEAKHLLGEEETTTDMKVNKLLHIAKENDEETNHLFEQIGTNIGLGISNMIHILNPELIVIGGKITAFKQWIKEPLLKTLEKRANIFYKNKLRISFSELGHDSVVLGGTSKGISHLFQETRVTIN